MFINYIKNHTDKNTHITYTGRFGVAKDRLPETHRHLVPVLHHDRLHHDGAAGLHQQLSGGCRRAQQNDARSLSDQSKSLRECESHVGGV